MRNPFVLTAVTLLLAVISAAASTGLDFETTSSLTQLPANWSVGGNSSLVSLQASCQAPATMIGTTGTKGLRYSSSTGAEGYLEYDLPAGKTSVSIGMAYRTGASYPWVEGPHFLGFGSFSFGDLSRISDERSSLNNTRQFRISPAENNDIAAAVSVADNTWYWVTLKYVAGGDTVMNVYDSSLILVGSATWNSGFNSAVNYIFIANDMSGSGESFTTCMDNFMEDDVTATFPLLPVPPDTIAPSTPTGLEGAAVSSFQVNLSWSGSTDNVNTPSQITYNVYRNGTKVGSTAAGVTTYSDTSLAASTIYTYAVSASDTSKNASSLSGSVEVTTEAPPPIAPGNYTTAGGYQATVSVQSSDGTMWLGSVVVNGTSVPTYWNTSGTSPISAFSLP